MQYRVLQEFIGVEDNYNANKKKGNEKNLRLERYKWE